MISSVNQEWLKNEQSLKYMSTQTPLLQQNVVRQAMYQGDFTLYSNELSYLESNYPNKLLKLSEAPVALGATVYSTNKGYNLCSNDLHHLYHLCRYQNSIGFGSSPLDIVEWGGGYGNMCKVFSYCFEELIGSYTIFDLPTMNTIQQKYLEQMGIEGVELLDSTTESSFNKSVDPSLFLSTWALSECPITTIDFINKKSNFLDNRILVSLHQCGNHIPFYEESCYLRDIALNRDCKEEDITIIPGKNSYLFK